MPKLKEIFKGSFLKADDLQGRTIGVVIETAELTEFDDGNKIVIGFRGKDKRFVCNKTNAHIIAENLHSDDTDNWLGKMIYLTPKKVEFQGKLVPSIRVVIEDKPAQVKPPTPSPAQAQPGDPVPDEIPF